MRHLLDRRILFLGGKGGVGKTTCAAALALAARRAGKKVLLVSTDPAHSTSDILETPLDSSEREILPGLTGLELDAARETRRYLDEAKARMAGVFRPAVVREAARQIELTASMPGVADVAVFDRMSDLIVSRAGTYDLVVFDTAPTGHALRLLRLPELMSSWVEALARRRREAVEAQAQRGGSERGRRGRRPGARHPRGAHVAPARRPRGTDARRPRRVRAGPDPGAAADRGVGAGGRRTVGGRDVARCASS